MESDTPRARPLAAGSGVPPLARSDSPLRAVVVPRVATPDIPSDVLVPSLVSASDVLGTGWFGAVAAQAGPGKTVAVVGDGAVGLLAVLAAKQLGAERIIAMSCRNSRQRLAREYGATDIVEQRDDAGVAAIKERTDGLGALNVMFYEQGDDLGWHFDNADVAVTLMLQAPESGGVFEYVPALRTASDQNPSGVAALLGGDRAGVRTLDPEPGTLSLFRGHLSPHRVTPVQGDVSRINAVVSYADRPDTRLSQSARRIFFGR